MNNFDDTLLINFMIHAGLEEIDNSYNEKKDESIYSYLFERSVYECIMRLIGSLI